LSKRPFEVLKDVILLDTGSTLKATFMNPDLVTTKIKVTRTPVSMTTNAGTKKIKVKATIPGFGSTWYDPNQIANIYGFSHMANRHQITYDSDKEDALLVHSHSGIIKFERTMDGIYVYRPTNIFKDKVASLKRQTLLTAMTNLISTVKENSNGYTQRQFESAKRARQLYHIVGCPTSRTLNIYSDKM
jgi:hypothetical protein